MISLYAMVISEPVYSSVVFKPYKFESFFIDQALAVLGIEEDESSGHGQTDESLSSLHGRYATRRSYIEPSGLQSCFGRLC